MEVGDLALKPFETQVRETQKCHSLVLLDEELFCSLLYFVGFHVGIVF